MNAYRAKWTKRIPRVFKMPILYILSYYRRMSLWGYIKKHVAGITPSDQRVISKSFKKARIQSLEGLGKWRPPRLIEDATVSVLGLGTFEIRANSDDLWHPLPRANGAIFGAIAENTNAGDVVVDAGANIGVTTVAFANQVGDNGLVVAVEMMPNTAAQLKKNVDLNKLSQVQIIEKALADADGHDVTATVSDNEFGLASIVSEGKSDTEKHEVVVKTITLDTVTQSLDRIAMLKIDLEGAEELALSGAVEMLKRTKLVLFESWEPDGGGAGKLLVECGFTLEQVDGINFLAKRSEE